MAKKIIRNGQVISGLNDVTRSEVSEVKEELDTSVTGIKSTLTKHLEHINTNITSIADINTDLIKYMGILAKDTNIDDVPNSVKPNTTVFVIWNETYEGTSPNTANANEPYGVLTTTYYNKDGGSYVQTLTNPDASYTRIYANNKWYPWRKMITDKEEVVNYTAKIEKNSALTYTNGSFSLIKSGRMAQFQLYDISIQSLKHGDVICTLPPECRPSVHTRASFTMPPSEGATKIGLSSNSDWVVLPGGINVDGTVVIYTTSTGAPARMSSCKTNVTYITAE